MLWVDGDEGYGYGYGAVNSSDNFRVGRRRKGGGTAAKTTDQVVWRRGLRIAPAMKKRGTQDEADEVVV